MREGLERLLDKRIEEVKCPNCQGRGTIRRDDKLVACERCRGTGIRPVHS